MRVMGLSNLVQWIAYFIINIVKLLVTVLFMSVTLTISINGKQVMDNSDWSVVFVFLFTYSICTVCYCFAISVFFKKGTYSSMSVITTGIMMKLTFIQVILLRHLEELYGSYFMYHTFSFNHVTLV